MKIGVDLDGVVCDYHTFFVDDVNQRYGKNLTLDDWTDYEFSNSGFSWDEFVRVIKNHGDAGCFAYLPEIPGAVEGIRTLKGRGDSIHVVTRRHGRARPDSVTWLENHGVPYDSISFSEEKGITSRLLGLDYMIEDDVMNSIDVRDTGTPVILHTRPWNITFYDPFRIHRVDNWKEILEVLGVQDG